MAELLTATALEEKIHQYRQQFDEAKAYSITSADAYISMKQDHAHDASDPARLAVFEDSDVASHYRQLCDLYIQSRMLRGYRAGLLASHVGDTLNTLVNEFKPLHAQDGMSFTDNHLEYYLEERVQAAETYCGKGR